MTLIAKPIIEARARAQQERKPAESVRLNSDEQIRTDVELRPDLWTIGQKRLTGRFLKSAARRRSESPARRGLRGVVEGECSH